MLDCKSLNRVGGMGMALVLAAGIAVAGVAGLQPQEPAKQPDAQPAKEPVKEPAKDAPPADANAPKEMKIAPPEVKVPEPAGAASLMLDSKVIDFGKVVLQGPPVEKKLTLANLGQADLQITELRGSCQCLTPSITSRSLKPGDEAEITATLDLSKLKVGANEHRITIRSNDPTVPMETVTVKLQGLAIVETDPKSVQFGKVGKGESKSVDVTVIGRRDAFAVNNVEVRALPGNKAVAGTVRSEIVESKILEIDGEKREAKVVRLTLTGDTAIGVSNREVWFTTNDLRQDQIGILMFGEIIGDLRLSQPRVQLGVLERGEEFTKTFTMTHAKGEKFNITSIEFPPNQPDELGLSFELDKDGPATEYTITVKGKAGDRPGRVRPNFFIKTDVKGEETINAGANAMVR